MKKKFSDEEYSGQDSATLEEESDKNVKKRMSRKELRRRYPKHHWPDNPLEAQAVRGVKRR